MSEQNMLTSINCTINLAAETGQKIQCLMFSPEAFKGLKMVVPRKQYRSRQGSRFINAYRGIPIEIHDEWSWGWTARYADGSFA